MSPIIFDFRDYFRSWHGLVLTLETLDSQQEPPTGEMYLTVRNARRFSSPVAALFKGKDSVPSEGRLPALL